MDYREQASSEKWWDSLDGKTARYQGQSIPVRFLVCPTCDGRGGYVNPSIDSQGLSRDDMDGLGEEFEQDYMAGAYDVCCEHCEGLRVVPEPIRPADQERIQADQNDAYEMLAIQESERSMGA